MNDKQTTIGSMKDLVQGFVDERDWRQFHDPKNLSMSLAIEAAELMEHFQWLRSDQLSELRQDQTVMSEVAEELADVFCYLLSFASAMEIDLAEALAMKMKKNRVKYPADQFKGRF